MTKKIYHDNPYIREISARVIKKEYSDNKFYFTLDRTIFYPHMSGGQPRDKGTINGIEVLDVFEDGNDIIHVLDDNVIDDKVHLSIDWNTRFDHMQQHTGQHLLSSVFSKLYSAKTIGFHLGKDFVYIDVTLPNLSSEDAERAERFANEIVYSNFDIKSYIIGKNDISSIPLRKMPTVDTNIRIVEIDGIEYVPCGGTHHRNIGEVGIIKIRKWERYKGNTRIEFVCGNRALKDYSWKNSYINEISNILSVKDTESLEGFRRVFDENKLLAKENRLANEELLKYKSENILREAFLYKDYTICAKIFDNVSFKDVKHIVSNITSHKNTIVCFGVKEESKCQIVIGKSENIPLDIQEMFKSIITIVDGKGGGSPLLVQGGGPKAENLTECLEAGLNIIRDML